MNKRPTICRFCGAPLATGEGRAWRDAVPAAWPVAGMGRFVCEGCADMLAGWREMATALAERMGRVRGWIEQLPGGAMIGWQGDSLAYLDGRAVVQGEVRELIESSGYAAPAVARYAAEMLEGLGFTPDYPEIVRIVRAVRVVALARINKIMVIPGRSK